MTDISELVKRMRGLAEYVDDCEEAADALEAQAKEIEELREALKETLAIAERNELGDYQLRASAKLNGEKG